MSNFRYEFSEVCRSDAERVLVVVSVALNHPTIRLGYKTRQDKTRFIQTMFLLIQKIIYFFTNLIMSTTTKRQFKLKLGNKRLLISLKICSNMF